MTKKKTTDIQSPMLTQVTHLPPPWGAFIPGMGLLRHVQDRAGQRAGAQGRHLPTITKELVGGHQGLVPGPASSIPHRPPCHHMSTIHTHSSPFLGFLASGSAGLSPWQIFLTKSSIMGGII